MENMQVGDITHVIKRKVGKPCRKKQINSLNTKKFSNETDMAPE
jgi:hypothetical protein